MMGRMLRPLLLAVLFAAVVPAQKPLLEPLTGTVVDPDGKAVAGAMVEVWRADGRDMNGLDLAYWNTYRLLNRAPTNRAGAFGVQVPRGLRCQLRIDQPPFARWLCDAIDAGEPMRIALAPPATFAGKVTLPDGTGTPAKLRAWNDERTYVLDARTDEHGVFRCERLPAGTVTVELAPDRASAPEWTKITFVAGETVEHDFTCAVGEVLRGRVVDAATGKPIAGAQVGEGWVLHRAVAIDKDGVYELPGFGSQGHGEVHCTAEGYVRVLTMTKDIAPATPRSLDLRLDRGNAAAGIVVAPDGAPLAGVYVAAVGTVHNGQEQYHYWVSGRTDAAGRFHLQGVRPDLPPTLLVRHDGWATLVLHLPQAKDGVHDAGRVDMRKARLLTGRVVDADGKPVARVAVGLWGSNADRSRMATLLAGQQGYGGWDLLRMYLDQHQARTDSSGRFAFGDLPAGEFGLVVYGPRNERLAGQQGIVVSADADPEPIELSLSK
jgi:protocatechuate 3,4-dioxygenase beta subunit